MSIKQILSISMTALALSFSSIAIAGDTCNEEDLELIQAIAISNDGDGASSSVTVSQAGASKTSELLDGIDEDDNGGIDSEAS